MNNGNSSPMVIRVRVRLEPVLEQQSFAWSQGECDDAADKFARWSRQLRVKAAILRRDGLPRVQKLKRARHPDWS